MGSYLKPGVLSNQLLQVRDNQPVPKLVVGYGGAIATAGGFGPILGCEPRIAKIRLRGGQTTEPEIAEYPLEPVQHTAITGQFRQ